MRIIVNEQKNKLLLKLMIQEEIFGLSDKVLIVKKYLDDHYIKADIETLDDISGDLKKEDLVIMLDSRKEPTEHRLSLEQLYYKIQDKYKNIISDKKERNMFLWQVINDWFKNKISKHGTLSK